MKETRIPDLNIDLVGKRLERIIEEKKAANEEALGKIKALADSWEELNKAVGTDIREEFQLMELEEQALAEALGDLEVNRVRPVKDAFSLSGKVLTEKEGIGLPNVTVTLSKRVDRKTALLAKAVTGSPGNFLFRLGKDASGVGERAKMEVEYQVIAGDGTLLHSEVQTLTPRPGGMARVTLAVAESDVVSNQLEAGKAVRDSIVESRELIASRVESMRGAHDGLAKMTGIARDELETLRIALAVTPPGVKGEIVRSVLKPDVDVKEETKPTEEEKRPASKRGKRSVLKPPSGRQIKPRDEESQREPKPGPRSKPGPPTVEKAKQPGKSDKEPVRPKERVPGLETIKGIGPRRAEILRKANIKDIQTFVKTDGRKLTELLGELDSTAMKKEGRVLLKKK